MTIKMTSEVTQEERRDNLVRRVETTTCRVYQDPDGYEIIEQDFDDGSKVMMHKVQFDAIARTVARSPKLQQSILYLAGEGEY